MVVILNIDAQKFSLNGIPYFKNFMPHVVAGKLKIVNVYDAKFELVSLENSNQYSVNGIVHTTVVELQNALLPVTYMRNSLSSDNSSKLDKGGYTGTAQDLDNRISELVLDVAVADKNHTHIQGIPSTTWTINHNLNKYPSVSVIDNSGNELEGEVHHINENTTILNFSAAVSGRANIN
jgi:hypothetical protein